MTSNKKDPVLVVLQMSGAYDALNTVIPYNDPHYADYRAELKVEPEQVLAIDDKVGFHPAMAPIKDLYDQGKVAVIQASDTPTRFALTSVPWTSGIPRSRPRWPPKVGWAGPSKSWTRRRKMC